MSRFIDFFRRIDEAVQTAPVSLLMLCAMLFGIAISLLPFLLGKCTG